jgi:hypothetical protein
MPISRKTEASRNPAALFRTANLNLASYLVASNRLALDHVEPNASHSEFFFLDPENRGPAIAVEFVTKDLKVSVKLLFDARARLLNEMRRERSGA